MPNITLSVSEALKKEMDAIPEINWSESVRGFLSEKVKRAALLKKLDTLLENSTLSEEDADKFAIELGRKIKKGRFEQLKRADRG
jgi:hypothetical protein